jgi:hypothetical protein
MVDGSSARAPLIIRQKLVNGSILMIPSGGEKGEGHEEKG